MVLDFQDYGVSERKSCKILNVNRSSVRYHSVFQKDSLNDEIKDLAVKFGKYGYRMVLTKLRERHDFPINHKRVYRLYSLAKLLLKKPRWVRVALQLAEQELG